jgi:thiol-disulfide isomerase/thioredoxin
MNFKIISVKTLFDCVLLITVFSTLGLCQVKRPVAAKPVVAVKATPASTGGPVVTQVDDAKLNELLKPKNGRPLLINFWATWCDPCREEFPDLVKIDADYKGKIDFITVTLDDVEDIKGVVPKFLSDMKATMPAYLLVSSDESAIIGTIAKDWTGGLPFTVLYNEKGEMAYFRQGKVRMDLLKTELDKLARAAATAQVREQ